MLVRTALVAACGLFSMPGISLAQVSAPAPESTSAAAAVVVEQLPASGLTIPALTPVDLVIDTDLGSKISITGATFALHLGKPIVIDGRELIPAGTEGQGEVIHAKKAGGSGSSGELVLAARFLKVGDLHLKLRSMRIAIAGKDATAKVDGLNAAAAGASVFVPVPIGLIGFAITGGNTVLPKGTTAMAKTAEAFDIGTATTAAGSQDEPSKN